MTIHADGLTLPDLLDEFDHAQAWSLALVDGLTPAQVAWRPNEDSSAMAWHLGHQAVVTHFMVRNLTAAEVTFNAAFDAVFDSATPEPGRGGLPALEEIVGYREQIATSTRATVTRIATGDVGAPQQLNQIASAMMRGIINHEYQHAKWVGEVRATMLDGPLPAPASTRLVQVEGYHMLSA